MLYSGSFVNSPPLYNNKKGSIMIKPLLALSCAVFLSSCAMVSHVPMSQENKKNIHSVYVNPSIKKPKEMYNFASGAEFGVAFGAVGGLIAGAASEKQGTSIQAVAEKNRIDIRNIVYNQWREQLAEKSRLKVVSSPDAPELTADIVMYGFSIPHGFSSDYVPVLAINAKLTNHHQVIWQDSGRVHPMSSGMPRYKLKEIMQDPKKMQMMWNKAAETIIQGMVKDMDV